MNEKLSRSNDDVRRLLAITFPEYRGRKIRLQITDRMTLKNYWDGGTRSYYRAVDLNTGRTSEPIATTGNPFRPAAHAEFVLPPRMAVVEHSIFCGTDAGITVHVRHDSRTALIGFNPPQLTT